jgi:hypothetical protein
VKRRSHIALIGAGALLFVIGARVIFAFVNYARVERNFPLIRQGDPRDYVAAKLGKPNYYHGNCGVIHVPNKECALEYVYSHPFAPLIPEYLIVSFSKNGRVIEAESWDSP